MLRSDRASRHFGFSFTTLCCHLPSASLGHYAALSFIVKGRSLQITSESCELNGLNDFNNFTNVLILQSTNRQNTLSLAPFVNPKSTFCRLSSVICRLSFLTSDLRLLTSGFKPHAPCLPREIFTPWKALAVSTGAPVATISPGLYALCLFR